MRGRQPPGFVAAAMLAGALYAAPVQAAALRISADATSPLRICADPDNLPFSSATAATPGLYVELGQQMAQALGRPFTAVWTISYFGSRAVRTTLLEGKCDATIGLPDDASFMGPKLIFSQPFLQVGYALMAPPGQPLRGIDDLAGKAVAVQFSTPPQLALASRDDIRGVTFLNPDEAVQALVERRVDAAFVWGPIAGYANAGSLHGGYQVVPVGGQGMQWPVGVGFARANSELRDQVNAFLTANTALVASLAAKYGLPGEPPVEAASPIKKIATVGEDSPAPPTQTALSEPAPPPREAGAADVAAGREIFNGTCSHCHGPDATQSERRINLRLLDHRYGAKMAEVFHDTVTHGRLDKGMPNWTGVFTEDEFNKILAFLRTVQTN